MIDTLTVGSWGDIKTVKTTFGLTFPKPLIHFNLDLGFHRASHRFPAHKTISPFQPLTAHDLENNKDILSKDYMIPVRFPGQPPQGVLNLWQQAIIPEIMLTLQHPGTRSVLIDTGTVMWQVCKDAQLERVQQAAAQKDRQARTNLIQMEYALPNQEMRAILSAARMSGKNIYVTHHIGGKYEDRPDVSGRVSSVRVADTWDGWSHLGAIMDVVLRHRIDVRSEPAVGGPTITKTPVVDIETCGYTLSAEGITLPNPDFSALLNVINVFRSQESVA